MKKLENMSVDELLKEVKVVHKEIGFTPEKFNTSTDGTIILDSTNESDREWYENDEDYKL